MKQKKFSYRDIDTRLFSQTFVEQVPHPNVFIENSPLVDQYSVPNISQDIVNTLSGEKEQKGIFSQAYAGHQFWGFSILWDGRAHIIQELEHQDTLYDIQLKGSGKTPYSRRWDGKATLSAMLREYLISEAMYYLWIPTSRSLGVYTTGETVYRDEDPRGAILARLAQSHIRIGTFQYIATLEDQELLKKFTDHTIHRHYPEVQNTDKKYEQFILAVAKRQTQLVSEWIRVGFIHGVMNTDNTFISGETLDYGPCAFINSYNPEKVFSSIDTTGRYSFLNQARIIIWNLARFIETLLPLLSENQDTALEKAEDLLEKIQTHMQEDYNLVMHKKLGFTEETELSRDIITEFLWLLHTQKLDYTNSFVSLEKYLQDKNYSDEIISMLGLWVQKWKKTLVDISKSILLMQKTNPKIIPRNHLVERALKEAREWNTGFFQEFLTILSTPYIDTEENIYKESDPNDQTHTTFCGT